MKKPMLFFILVVTVLDSSMRSLVAESRKPMELHGAYLSRFVLLKAPTPFDTTRASISNVRAAELQSAPTGSPSGPVRRNHHKRNLVIIMVLGAVLLISLAAAAK